MSQNNIFDSFEEVRQLISEYSIEDLQYKMVHNQDFILIDIREDHEWLTGHIPSAIHLKRGNLTTEISQIVPDKNQEIILYCAIGFRSALSALELENIGYTNVYSLYGGIIRWDDLGLTVEMPLSNVK
ncbi:MAG: sulfurtransferase [Proteobacteria bacterium]|nr:MAG: sulfurtransferase [Pseudomonadota bacterium]